MEYDFMTEQEWLTSTDPAAMLAALTQGHDAWQANYYRVSDRQLRLFACACYRRKEVWDGVECSEPDEPLDHSLDCACGHGDCPGTYLKQSGRIDGLDPRSRNAVEVAERFADGEATEEELKTVREEAFFAQGREPIDIRHVAWQFTRVQYPMDWDYVLLHTGPPAVQATLLRDIIGNPFRPVCMVPCKWCGREDCLGCLPWNDGTIPRLAQHVYDDNAFHLMPIMADALEEAGCKDVMILEHCRQVGIRCTRCNGTGKIRVPGGHGDWDTVWCPDCNKDEVMRTIGVGGPHPGWLKPPPKHVRGCWVVDLMLGKS